MKPLRGFTIIELMITVVIIAVMTTLAAPSFTRMIRQNRLTTQVNEFIASANLAKSEAIRRSANVQILTGSTDAVFSSSGFSVATSAATGTPLRVFAKFTGSTTLTKVTGTSTYTADSSSEKGYVEFNSRGGINNTSTPAQFKACDTTDNAVGARIIKINAVGQISVTTASSTTCP